MMKAIAMIMKIVARAHRTWTRLSSEHPHAVPGRTPSVNIVKMPEIKRSVPATGSQFTVKIVLTLLTAPASSAE